jgi:2-amino-4-hydroxy-6-hydroxymethyldihydropteridine diphosphokinase
MPTCLLALGSNVGDREATLRAALEEIDALPNARLSRQSTFHPTRPLGMRPGADEFLNAAAVVEATIEPLRFLEHLQRIESRHGRKRDGHWDARTLDIDLLLYGDEVLETAMLTVPHLRMAFRRFVLEPAVEIAPKMIHPVIGWPLERLLLHLDAARDEIAVLSPSESVRGLVGKMLTERCAMRAIERPTFKTADTLWPRAYCTWFAFEARPAQEKGARVPSEGLAYAAAAFPKLTILLDADGDGATAAKAKWSAIVRRPGRGPTLRLQQVDQPTVQAEVFAAVESVWPDLGQSQTNRLE